MPDPTRYDAVTFDCYGTLIDWESGLLAALMPLMRARGSRADSGEVLSSFAAHESALEAGPFQRYREVLRGVLAAVLIELTGAPPAAGEADLLADSLSSWPPFSDTVESLRCLRARYRLGILSNVDDDLFAGTLPHLGVDFDWLVTAEQAACYKPNPANFHALLQRLDLPASRVLHVAQSLFHDVGPARQLGINTVWVNRRSGKSGAGATPEASAVPDLEVPDLATLVRHLGLAGE